MAGYYGYSMSNNAVMAYNGGEKPLTKWTKSEILREAEEIAPEKVPLLRALPVRVLRENFLRWSSWHHTSSHYNRTDFYIVDEDKVCEATPETVEQMKTEEQPKPETVRTFRGDFSYLEWGGTRKHPKATRVDLHGVTITEKGKFYIVTDNAGAVIVRKMIDSNGTVATKTA